jgi:hypothetical protein
LTVHETFDKTLGELRVTQAYITLLSISEQGAGTRMVPVARIGNYEIRIFDSLPSGSDSEPVIWMELFDHDVQLVIDSSRCGEIEDALVVFEDFFLQANFPDEACQAGSHDTQA